MVTSTLRRLCSRAPRTINASSAITRVISPQDRGETSRGGRSSLDYVLRRAAPPGFPPCLRPPSPKPHTHALLVLTTLPLVEGAVTLLQMVLGSPLVCSGSVVSG